MNILKVVKFVLWVILMIFDPFSTIVSLIIGMIDKIEDNERMEGKPMNEKNGRNLGDIFLKNGMAI